MQALQLTLRGAPNIYDVGDSENQRPVRWDLLAVDNAEPMRMKQRITRRKTHRALRVGDHRAVERGLGGYRWYKRVKSLVLARLA